MTDLDRLNRGPLADHERLGLTHGATREAIAEQLWNGDVREQTAFELLLPGLGTLRGPRPWERGVSVRTANILRNNDMATWETLAQRDSAYVRNLPNLGRKTFVEIISTMLLAWAEDSDAVDRAPSQGPAGTTSAPPACVDPAPAPLLQHSTVADLATVLRRLWAENGATTIESACRDVPSLFAEDVPPDVREAADRLAATSLDVALSLPTLDAAGWAWILETLDPRERDVLLRRRYTQPANTLEEIGRIHNVTRERIRQIEHSAAKALTRRLADRRADGLHHLAAGVRRGAPGLITREQFDGLLDHALDASGAPDAERSLSRGLLAGLTGERREWNGYLAPVDLLADLAGLRTQLEAAGAAELIEPDSIDKLLERMRVPHRSPEILGHLGVGVVNDNLVWWGRSHGDRAAAALAAHGRVLTFAELHAAVGHHINPRSMQNATIADQRIVRRGKDTYGLRIWGGAEYGGLIEEIEQAVIRAGGRVELAPLVEQLVSDFGVKAGSVLSYAADRRFVKHADGTLAMRTGDDPEVEVRFIPIEATAGAFRLDGIWHARVEIDDDVMRGSGQPLRRGFAFEAGLEPDLTFAVAYDGGSVTFSWRGGQPNLGSIRAIAQHHGLVVGDVVLLPLTGPEPRGSRVLRLIDRTGWAGVARVGAEMGLDPSDIDEDEQPIEVAEALGLPPGADWGDIVDRLVDRRDPLAELLPDHLR